MHNSPFYNRSVGSFKFGPVGTFEHYLLSLTTPDLVEALHGPSPATVNTSRIMSAPPMVTRSVVPETVLFTRTGITYGPMPRTYRVSWIKMYKFETIFGITSHIGLVSQLGFVATPTAASPVFSSYGLGHSAGPFDTTIGVSILLASTCRPFRHTGKVQLPPEVTAQF